MYDELVKRLRDIATSDSNIKSNYIGLSLLQAADAIEELSKENESLGNDLTSAVEMLKKRKKPKWIPVTERLPNCNGCYLVWRPHFFGGKIGMPSICYFDGSNTWHDSYGVDFERTLHPEDITHWMPLPEPPKEE